MVDGDDFDDWYLRARPSLHSALVGWCGDREVAAESLDEAFVRALERWDRVRRMDSATGWVWTTATNHVRRTKRRRKAEHMLWRRHATAVDPVVEGPTGDDIDLRRSLLRLTERQRSAVVLFYLADLSTREVAEIMGTASGTVSATLHQARRQLAKQLGEREEPGTTVLDNDGGV